METQRDKRIYFYFMNNINLQTIQTPNNRSFWNLGRPRNHKFPVGKGKYFEKFSKIIKTCVVNDQLVYVRGLCIIQNVYACMLYKESGAYTFVNFQKKKKFGQTTRAREDGRHLEGY